MHIVGHETDNPEPDHVHTIDLWFSEKRKVWIVERLNADGHHVGATYQTKDVHDARACLEEWLRIHAETHLVGRDVPLKRRRAAVVPKNRAA